MGGVLSQKDSQGRLKPIAYFFSGLNPAQRQYAAGEIECWAIIAMSRKFNDYIKAARKVYFVTDHNPLHWLRKQRDPRGKFARWIQELESLDYEVVYTKGNLNNAADFLFRIESDIDSQVNNEFEYFERFVYHLTMSYPELVEMIEKEQLKDQAIKYAREQVLEVGNASRGRYTYNLGTTSVLTLSVG